MRVPEEFAGLIRVREGVAGEAWLRTLPGVVEALLGRWACVPDGEVRHGGVALVVPVIGPQGAAVVKVSAPQAGRPRDGLRYEAAVLRLVDGRGAVRLLAEAPEHAASLLERADGPGPEAVLSAEESVEMMGDLARQLAEVPVVVGSVDDPAVTPRPLSETAAGWRAQLEDQVVRAGGTVPGAVIDRAREAIGLAAADRVTTVLHGDLHEGNVLRARRRPWLAIDLTGWSGTAAYDAFTVALTRPGELAEHADARAVVAGRVRRFAAAAGVDEELAAELTHARAVSSLLHELVQPVETFGRDLLARVVGV